MKLLVAFDGSEQPLEGAKALFRAAGVPLQPEGLH